jgi:hypothetical protein
MIFMGIPARVDGSLCVKYARTGNTSVTSPLRVISKERGRKDRNALNPYVPRQEYAGYTEKGFNLQR